MLDPDCEASLRATRCYFLAELVVDQSESKQLIQHVADDYGHEREEHILVSHY